MLWHAVVVAMFVASYNTITYKLQLPTYGYIYMHTTHVGLQLLGTIIVHTMVYVWLYGETYGLTVTTSLSLCSSHT